MMKVLPTGFQFAVALGTLICFCVHVDTVHSIPLDGSYVDDPDNSFVLTNHANGIDPCSDGVGLSYEENVCAMVQNGNTKPGTPVVLDQCTTDLIGQWGIWFGGEVEGFMLMLGADGASGQYGHGGIDIEAHQDVDARCMQAGHGDSDLGSRATARLYPCDINNPLQRWTWSPLNVGDDDDSYMCASGRIQLVSDPNFCLAWRGANHIKPGTTPLIVMPCDEIKGVRAKGWFAY